jgi:hypothetical protein
MELKYGVLHLKISTWNGLIHFLGGHRDMDTQQKAFIIDVIKERDISLFEKIC